jgi:hypothetical protein
MSDGIGKRHNHRMPRWRRGGRRKCTAVPPKPSGPPMSRRAAMTTRALLDGIEGEPTSTCPRLLFAREAQVTAGHPKAITRGPIATNTGVVIGLASQSYAHSHCRGAPAPSSVTSNERKRSKKPVLR